MRTVKAQSRARRKADLKAAVDRIKVERGCHDCGSKALPPYCYDFDHRDPASKEWNISELVRKVSSMQRIADEIDKCDVVCSNCHRIRTHG